jgi:hypothetical protein
LRMMRSYEKNRKNSEIPFRPMNFWWELLYEDPSPAILGGSAVFGICFFTADPNFSGRFIRSLNLARP